MSVGFLRRLRKTPPIIPYVPPSHEKRARLEDVDAIINRRDFVTAEAICRDAIQHDTRDIRLKERLAYIAQQTARYHEALAICAGILAEDAENWEAHFLSGLSASALGRHAEAAKAFEAAHILRPQHARAARLALDEAAECGDTELADRVYAGFSSVGSDRDVLKCRAGGLLKSGRIEPLRQVLAEEADFELLQLFSVTDWAAGKSVALEFAGDVETIDVRSPATFGETGFRPAGPELKVTSYRPYAAELQDATIFSKSGIVVTPDCAALDDMATHPEFGRLLALSGDPLVVKRHEGLVLIDRSDYKLRDHPGGVFLGGPVSGHFGHWVPEFLPKLDYLERHPSFAGLPLLVDEDMPASHFDYLGYLVDNPVMRIPTGMAFHCERLLVAPTPTFHHAEILSGMAQHHSCLSPRSLRFLRERVLSRVGEGTSAFGSRLYLSRRNMTWRRLENEDEIASWLETEGFRTVFIEDLSFSEQVALFRGAECIVAANGSALLNAIFAKPGVKLIVLSQPNTFNWGGFYGPMRSTGYDSLFVLGETRADYKHADYRIPLRRLQDAMRLEQG